jgi:hypothetical protein
MSDWAFLYPAYEGHFSKSRFMTKKGIMTKWMISWKMAKVASKAPNSGALKSHK